MTSQLLLCVRPILQRFASTRSKSNRQRGSAVLKDKRFDRMYKDPNFMDGGQSVEKLREH